MIEAILVMLNNYLHDLMVAFLFASSLIGYMVLKYFPGAPDRKLVRALKRIAFVSLGWVLVGGCVRAYYFKEYEWYPKAGSLQIPALVVKHVILVMVTVMGLYILRKLSVYAEKSTKREE